MDFFKDKCAVVTGAAIGIGQATALLLGQHGAKVIVSDINEAAGNKTVEMIEAAGGTAKFIACNVANKEEVKELIVQSIAAFGPVKFAVNNAGIGGKLAPTHEIKFADWDKMIAVNLSGVFYCLREEISAMLHHGGGNIVNVASLAGLGPVPRGNSYCAAKHGVIGLTRTAAVEYAKLNIRVNAVCPGWTETAILDNLPETMLDNSLKNYVPMGRLGKPSEVAETIIWLLSDKASFVTGHSLAIDGGMKSS